jgi:iron(III) transport system substrate-binding protein
MRAASLLFRLTGLSFALLGLQFLSGVSSAQPLEPKPAWQAEGEKTLEAAKREGQIVLYHASDHDLVFAEFQKRYPDIKLISWRGFGPDTIQRVMAERRGGKHLADVFALGATSGYTLYKANAYDPIQPVLFLPEVVDRSKWWQGRHHYVDPEGKYMFVFNGINRVEVSYNSNLVDPRDFKSYWDLLKPEWKGKIVVLDPTSGGAGTALRFLYYNSELGPEYLKRLFGEMDAGVSRDGRQIADWLATGKYAIAMLIGPDRMDLDLVKKQGLPVSWFDPKHFKEGAALTAGPGLLYLANRAPHPNAAKLAVNWFLSREGQIIAQKIFASKSALGMDSLRIDIPKEDVPPISRRIEGIKYILTDRSDWIDMKPIQKLVNESWIKGKK